MKSIEVFGDVLLDQTTRIACESWRMAVEKYRIAEMEEDFKVSCFCSSFILIEDPIFVVQTSQASSLHDFVDTTFSEAECGIKFLFVQAACSQQEAYGAVSDLSIESSITSPKTRGLVLMSWTCRGQIAMRIEIEVVGRF